MNTCCGSPKPTISSRNRGVPRELPVAVIGGGSVGLAAAARLLERGMEPLVVEVGTFVGALDAEDGRYMRLRTPGGSPTQPT